MKKKKTIRIINSIKNILIRYNLVSPKKSLIIAISGGQDSIVLLIIIFILKTQWIFEINIFSCNHLWERGSFYSYFHISKIAFCFNIKIMYSISTKDLNSEIESRYWRSKNYCRLNSLANYSIIFTGHTLTDQIETFFFNTARGSSFTGSSSLKVKKKIRNKNENDFFISEFELIKFFKIKNNFLNKDKKRKIQKKSNNIWKKKFLLQIKEKYLLEIIRPLIIETRFDIKNICQSWKLPLFIDQSNQKTKYSRNLLRKQFLPTCRFFFNPKIDLSLSRHNIIMNEEEKYIKKLIIKLLKELITEDKNNYYFNIVFFNSLSFSLQRKICLYFFKNILKINYNFLIIDSFIKFSTNFYISLKKRDKYSLQYKKSNYIFFPEIGTIFLSKTLFIFLK